MDDELIFYTNTQSRGRTVRWMLEEVGVPYTTKILEYGSAMKAPEYLAINPMGKVPTIRHGDAVVTESAAICAYLADAFPEAGLAPPLSKRSAYYRWLFFAAGPLEAAVINTYFGFEVPAEQERSVGYGNLALTLDALETAVSDQPFLCGDTFTAADVYVGGQVALVLQLGELGKRASFEAYVGRVSDRDASRRAADIDGTV